jgi:hypothetical protein
VELVSGSLEIETAPGKGTRVLVEAPLVTGEPDATRNEYARS